MVGPSQAQLKPGNMGFGNIGHWQRVITVVFAIRRNSRNPFSAHAVRKTSPLRSASVKLQCGLLMLMPAQLRCTLYVTLARPTVSILRKLLEK